MSLSTRNALSAYNQAGLDARVAAASPHGLIVMLFEGALAAIAKARFLIEEINAGNKDSQLIADKGLAISKAVAIVEDGLKASLNVEAGGELAANLFALYEYLGYRLIQANLNNDAAALDEVNGRLTELREAWEGMEIRPGNPSVATEPSVGRSGVVTYGRV